RGIVPQCFCQAPVPGLGAVQGVLRLALASSNSHSFPTHMLGWRRALDALLLHDAMLHHNLKLHHRRCRIFGAIFLSCCARRMASIDDTLKEAINQYVDADLVTDELKEARQNAERKQKVTLKKVLEALDAKRIELLDIVLHLEKVMNDASNPTGRRHALQFLAECLRDVAHLKMNFKHVETFASFFSSKLSDWQCVEGAVGGILALLRRQGALVRTLKKELPDGTEEPLALYIARAIFKEVHTPSHTQAVRKMVLDTAILLMDEWHSDLVLLGPQLGEGVAAAIEEERDPRNLLVSFTIVKKAFQDFPPECITKETAITLFETLSSYFPITFEPPKGDKIGITGEDLRRGLSQALCSSDRLANYVVPFLLDSSKDIEADSDATVEQAMGTLQFCLEKYGQQTAQKFLKDIIETARDQVCRTKTTCSADFCAAVTKALQIAMKGIPAGLHPHWLSKDVSPEIKEIAEDASRGRMSLASDGARELLLAMATAHRVMFESVWRPLMDAMLVKTDSSENAAFNMDSLSFLVDLLLLRPKGSLSPKQLQPALAGSLASLFSIHPYAAGDDDGVQGGKAKIFCTAVELVGHLSLGVGEANSKEAFAALRDALLGTGATGANGDLGGQAWAQAWHAELSVKAASDPCVASLVEAVCKLVSSHASRATEFAQSLQNVTLNASPWLAYVLPKLLAYTAVSLANAKEAQPEQQAGAEELSCKLLQRAATIFKQHGSGHFEVLGAFADALDGPGDFSWASGQLAKALGLPDTLPELVEGLSTDLEGGTLPAVDIVLSRAEASRRFMRVLCRHLPEQQASAVQRRVLESVALSSCNVLSNCIALVPGVLPQAAEASWSFCRKTMPAVCRCASGADPDLVNSQAAEVLALQALESLVESCPDEEVSALLQNFRDTFGQLLRGRGQSSAGDRASRGAATCWASATAALLRRRGSCSEQAGSFLEALLLALDEEAPVGPYVPEAFRVLAPVKVDSSKQGRDALPPIALQQLSRTVLPSLVSRAKALGGTAWTRLAALESAVALLASLSVEVACADCSDELRWCTLTGLKRLKESAAAANAEQAAIFAVQVLQLLVRAIQRKESWVEDELHSIVGPLCELCGAHCKPLVRLGCFQVLMALIQQAFGHLSPFKKEIQAGCKKGVEDRCREVRLLAVATLNTCQKQSGRRKSAAAPDRRRTSLSKAQQLDCGEGSRAHSTRQGRFYGGTQQGLEREVRRNCSRG
ncbi:mms19, partial [Symbiodinium sp. KB8]